MTEASGSYAFSSVSQGLPVPRANRALVRATLKGENRSAWRKVNRGDFDDPSKTQLDSAASTSDGTASAAPKQEAAPLARFVAGNSE